jgi:hypothetical protein
MTKYLSKLALFLTSGSRRALTILAPKKISQTIVRNAHGQLTIFFAVTLVMVLTITAFVINVGMYVKAKINLQNAVDAAAWSGAAVQARQLTNIAYMNWELRNVYKEWLFKYYVLGGISLPQVKNPTGSGNINFRMQQFNGGPSDPYGFPSTCIDLSDNSNICKIYEVPGLPRFPPTGNISTDATSTAFLDAIASKKSADCAQRSRLNFASLAQWTYSAEGAELSAAPLLVGKRPGAYLKSIEIAMRIRNLERFVNEKPVTICSSGCGMDYQAWASMNPGPHKERTLKAYWAAMRNLGLPDGNNETPQQFTLTELAPNKSNPVNQKDEYSLSYLFIPKKKFSEFDKYYLDLKIYLINFAPFYTAFVPAGDNSGSVAISAKCSATKIAMPVPGYPLGFEKNPNIMTYYAVKGESTFIGLLNPFDEPPKLVAYAAAKPFGGRIGPRLFKTYGNSSNSTIFVNPNPPRSNQYVLGMKLETLGTAGLFKPGDAIPFNTGSDIFWVDEKSGVQAIGGWTDQDTRFVVPNMVYEYFPGSMPSVSGGNPMQVVEKSGTAFSNPEGGLFDSKQFEALRNNLPPAGAGYSSNEILAAIESVRGPTRYDAYNYLIPTYVQAKTEKIDSFQLVSPNISPGKGSSPDNLHEFKIFAPFYADGEPFLYNNQQDVSEVVQTFIKANTPAIEKYAKAMKDVSTAVLASGSGSTAPIYVDAANQLYNDASGSIACQSVAGDFISFYLGNVVSSVNGKTVTPFTQDYPDTEKNPLDCPPSLMASFGDYLSRFDEGQKQYYVGLFRYPEHTNGWGGNDTKYLTAWMPGIRQGASDDTSGTVKNPFYAAAGELIAKRNFYSTKFIAVDSVTNNGHYVNGNFPQYIEKNAKTDGDLRVLNYIELDSANVTQ